MSFKRRVCRFDGPDENTYVEVWQTVGTYEVVRARPDPLRSRRFDVYEAFSEADAVKTAAIIARELRGGSR